MATVTYVVIESRAWASGHGDDEPTPGGQVIGGIAKQDVRPVDVFQNLGTNSQRGPAAIVIMQLDLLQEIPLSKRHWQPPGARHLSGTLYSFDAVVNPSYVCLRIGLS